jgi:hypothetical protein
MPSRVVRGIRDMSSEQFRAAVDGFAERYVNDWTWWMSTGPARRPYVMGKILRRWQATRPLPMRRTRAEMTHPEPYLDDLLADAEPAIAALADLDVAGLPSRTHAQEQALRALWQTFAGLTVGGQATCVGITKGVLLATDGAIGPALDSQVRLRLGLGKPTTSGDWLDVLDAIADDIAAFERRSGPLAANVSPRFADLRPGRLYDMAFGPREGRPTSTLHR